MSGAENIGRAFVIGLQQTLTDDELDAMKNARAELNAILAERDRYKAALEIAVEVIDKLAFVCESNNAPVHARHGREAVAAASRALTPEAT